MIEVKFILRDGEVRSVQGQPGLSIMEVATQNCVAGIESVCGGAVQCGSCHAYLAPEFAELVPPPEEGELAMLDGVVHRKPESRLTCQVILTAEMDGVAFEVPPEAF